MLLLLVFTTGAPAMLMPAGPDHTNSLGMRLARIEPGPFRMGFEGESRGYLSAIQARSGLIHVISSRQHYTLNLAWLATPPPAMPSG